MADDKLQKRTPSPIKETGQYLLAFGVIASMLLVVGFPLFVIFFLGIFAYFLFKIFSAGTRNETREIFEFYLSANDILRDDERRWYGFEIKETIGRGEKILQVMTTAPPLVHFAVGALYHKIGDHSSAVNHLSYVLENETSDERSYVYPSAELRNYVRVLRKIERDPAEAPMTTNAVRALERARKNRGKSMLEDSRVKLPMMKQQQEAKAALAAENRNQASKMESQGIWMTEEANVRPVETADGHETTDTRPEIHPRKRREESFKDRKPILEVLHDIYDKNIQ